MYAFKVKYFGFHISSVGITNAGSQVYIQANNEEDMLTWINNLNESCKITVSQAPR